MIKKHPVPFRPAALALSALIVPAPIGCLLAVDSLHPVYAFVICAGLAYVFTVAITTFLLLPALWIFSWVAPIKGWLTTLLGGLIAFPLFVFWDYTNWGASGVDSGPPPQPYAAWLAKSWFSWEPLFIVGCGVVTAAAYHFFATRKTKPVTPQT